MTMIHINLLPVRQVKKREIGQQMIVLAGVTVVLALLVNYFWYSNRASEAERNQARIDKTRQDIALKEKIIGEVNSLNKRKREVEDKLKVLNDLRKSRSGPVRMMDALSTATPKKVWLKEFTEVQNGVNLKGSALSHEDVAEFMRGLDTVVWTPKGMGRLVEQKRDAKQARVELMAPEAPVEEFNTSDVGHFFTDVTLRNAAQTADSRPEAAGGKNVDFEITLKANYAI